MVIAVSAAIAAIFWSGILIGITYWMRKKNIFIKGLGIGSIVGVYLFCMLRMLLPLNFGFTVGIQTHGLFSDIFYSIFIKKYRMEDYYVTVFDGLVVVWAAVALFLLLQLALQYWDTCKMLYGITEEAEDARRIEMLQDIYEPEGRRRKITVLRGCKVDTPLGMGIFKRRILLPCLKYTEQELQYVIMHEYIHFLHGDLLIKMAVHIICCIFWWNPLVYLLRKDLEQSLEIRCDLRVTENLSKKDMIDYLSTILKTLKAIVKKNKENGDEVVAFCRKKTDVTKERFDYVVLNSKKEGESKKMVAAWIAVVCVIWVVSCTAFLVPSYDPPAEDIVTEPGVMELTPENTYVVYENGKYEIYVNGKPNGECEEDYADLLENSGFEIRRM